MILFGLFLGTIAYFLNLALIHTLGTFFLLAPVSFIAAVAAAYLIADCLFNRWQARRLYKIIAAAVCLVISILLAIITFGFRIG